MIRIIGFLAVSLLIVAGVIVMGGEETESTAESVATVPVRRIHPVKTVAVNISNSYQYQHTYLGEVVARHSSELGFERVGRIVSMDITVGDVFAEGDILAQLDTERLAEERNELIARTSQMEAQLDELVAGARAETISAAESTVNDLAHQLELAKRNLGRRRKLVDQAMAAREELEAADFGAQSIAAKLNVAKHQLDELKTGTRSEVIRAQQSVLMQSKSLLAQNQIEIDRSVIRAPYDCTVTARMADIGQIVSPGSQILSVVANADPEVWIGVPTGSSKTLKKGCSADVLIDHQVRSGVVKNIVPQLDQTTRTMTVIVSLPGTIIDEVPVGQTARLSIQQQIDQRGCWLPIGALLKGTRGLWSCLRLVEQQPDFVTDPSVGSSVGKLQRCDVEILHTDGDRVFVRSALDDGDQVVASGITRVAPDQWAYAVADGTQSASGASSE